MFTPETRCTRRHYTPVGIGTLRGDRDRNRGRSGRCMLKRCARPTKRFLTSTAGGVTPVSKVDGRTLGGGNRTISDRILELYWSKRETGWHATPVKLRLKPAISTHFENAVGGSFNYLERVTTWQPAHHAGFTRIEIASDARVSPRRALEGVVPCGEVACPVLRRNGLPVRTSTHSRTC